MRKTFTAPLTPFQWMGCSKLKKVLNLPTLATRHPRTNPMANSLSQKMHHYGVARQHGTVSTGHDDGTLKRFESSGSRGAT